MFNNALIKTYCYTQTYVTNNVKNFFKKEEGVTAVEYAIVVAGVAAVVLFIFGTTGPVQVMLKDTFEALGTKLKGLIGSGASGG